MNKINAHMYGDFFLASHQGLIIQCTKTLCDVDNFMIGGNLDIFEITNIISDGTIKRSNMDFL